MGKGQSDKYILDYNGGTIECDRVTKVLGSTKASAGLALWYGREERKGWLDFLAKLDPKALACDVYGKALNEMPLEDDDDLFASRQRDSKAGSGTTIHALIEYDAQNRKVPEDFVCTEQEWFRYKKWEDFKVKEGIEYVDAELRVYSPNLLVAGTMDLSILWNGVLWGIDTKTGALRRDASVQVATYWMLRLETLAIQENDTKRLEEIADAYAHGNIPNIAWPRLGVLHIEEDDIEIYEIDPKLPDRLARNFIYRLQAFRDDQTIAPFRRIYPGPKRLKNGEFKEPKWLRAG